jgi:anaerobic selenocysteine-containing dehydrogenase
VRGSYPDGGCARTAAILRALLGDIGRPGGGILALRGHASIQGSTAAVAGKIDVGGDLTVNYHTPMYCPEPAMDGWEKAFGFFGRQLSR